MSRFKEAYDLDLKAMGDDDEEAGGTEATGKLRNAPGARARVDEEEEDGEAAIFSVEREDGWKPEGVRVGSIRLAGAGGGVLFVSTADGNIVRWDVEDTEGAPELVELKGGRPDGGRVHSLFVDPTGRHALICLVSSGSGTCYYCYHTPSVSATGTRPVARELPSLRGHVLECVGWGRDVANKAGGASCAPFILGTAGGRVLEVKGLSGEERKDKGVSRLWDVPSVGGGQGGGEGGVAPILSLRWDVAIDGSKHVILVGTGRPTRIYQFSGGPTISAVFAAAASKPPVCTEIRGSGGGHTEAEVLHPSLVVQRLPAPWMAAPGGKASGKPLGDGFAALTGVGVYVGRVTSATALGAGGGRGKEGADASPLVAGTKIIPFPAPAGGQGEGGGRGGGREWAGDGEGASSSSPPLSVLLTDFHILLRYKTRVLCLSRLTAQAGVVWEHALPEERYGALRALLPSGAPSSGGTSYAWLVTDRALLRLTVTREGRGAWKHYLTLKDFEAAKVACGGDPDKVEEVYEATAEHMFTTGDVAGAAEAFARTSRPFEDTCLRLMAGRHRLALRAYLAIRLDALGGSSSTAPQRTILCTWLLEMYLDRINALVLRGGQAGGGGEEGGEDLEETCRELKGFLRERVNDLHAPTARALLAGHGRVPELLMFSRLTGDWARVVAHHMSAGRWATALESIRDAPTLAELAAERKESGLVAPISDSNSQEELWYRYSSLLMPLLPQETVTGWKLCPSLDPLRLVPTLVRFEQLRATVGPLPTSASPTAAAVTGGRVTGLLSSLGLSPVALAQTLDGAMIYVEWVIEEGLAPKGKEAAPLHNLLVALYANLPSEELLQTYVEQQLAGLPPAPPAGASAALCSGINNNPAVALAIADREAEVKKEAGEGGEEEEEAGPKFDLPYALRVFLAAGSKCMRSTVRIYCALGLYVEAVETALGGPGGPAGADVELAKEAANAPPTDEEFLPLRKRLWVRVATHVIASGGDAPGAIAVLHESGVLSIEDVLPYFPGNTTLGVFKEEVTESLREADVQIGRLRAEMRGYTQAAERIRGDIKALRSRCGAVRVGQKCELCKRAVLSRHFYLFPCTHAFHGDCLMAEALRHMTAGARRRAGELTVSTQRAAALLAAVSEQGLGAVSGTAGSAELATLGLASSDLSSASASDVTSALSVRVEELQSELDVAIAGDCVLCGEAMIESVVVPLGQETGNTYASSSRDEEGGGAGNGRDRDRDELFGGRGGGGGGGGDRAHTSSAPTRQEYKRGVTKGNGADEDWSA